MARFCKECGSLINEGDLFCSNCGTKIVETTAPQQSASENSAQQQSSQQQSNPNPYQQPQPKAQLHIHEDAPVDEEPQGIDWKKLKPKVTFGRLEISFISKRSLIIIAIFIAIAILLSLLQGCKTPKETTNSPNTSNSPTTTKVVTIKPTSTASSSSLLKSSGINGVKSFTLSDVDSKSLSSNETKQLDALASEIKAIGSYHVTVIGHADNTGTSEVNETVSEQRAHLVANYLRKKGVTNITTSGESYNHPVASNDTAEGRAKNRRVEIYVSTIGKYNPYK